MIILLTHRPLWLCTSHWIATSWKIRAWSRTLTFALRNRRKQSTGGDKGESSSFKEELVQKSNSFVQKIHFSSQPSEVKNSTYSLSPRKELGILTRSIKWSRTLPGSGTAGVGGPICCGILFVEELQEQTRLHFHSSQGNNKEHPVTLAPCKHRTTKGAVSSHNMKVATVLRTSTSHMFLLSPT